jgi:hypothetical protein
MSDNTNSGSYASDLLSRWNAMKSARSTWDTEWDQVARYCCPRKGNILTKLTPGASHTINIYDTTAQESGDIFGAGMMSNLMPAGEKWFRFQPKGDTASPALKEWLSEISDIAITFIGASNFYLAAHEDCIDAGHFGSSLTFLDQGKKKLLNYVNIPVGTFAWEEDAEGNVDTVGREWKWTARQAVQFWGKEALGKAQTDSLNDASPQRGMRQFTYVHFVEPRADADYRGGQVAGNKRPIRSCYLCVEDMQLIQEDGYYSMPYFGSRLLRSNNEIYGRGPGMNVLPEVKLVNAMERDMLIAIEKMVNPPWLMPDDTSTTPDSRPNGVTFWDTSNTANKPEQLALKNNVDLGEVKTEQKRERIRRGYYNDLFQMLTNLDEQKREKTAYEVQQMVAEKLLLFSPLFARYVQEKLNPMLARVVDILARAEAFPPAPLDARGAEYEIVYTSKIALAIKAAENQAFATMLALVEQVAAVSPSAPNVINWNAGVRRIAENVGLPTKLIRTDREADAITAQQMQAAQAQQAAETAKAAAGAVRDLGPQAQERMSEMAPAGST